MSMVKGQRVQRKANQSKLCLDLQAMSRLTVRFSLLKTICCSLNLQPFFGFQNGFLKNVFLNDRAMEPPAGYPRFCGVGNCTCDVQKPTWSPERNCWRVWVLLVDGLWVRGRNVKAEFHWISPSGLQKRGTRQICLERGAYLRHIQIIQDWN